MRRSRAVVLLLLLSLPAIGGVLGANLGRRSAPRVIVDASVAPDFARVITQTWAQFSRVFAARRDCIGDVVVRADYDLAERAMYDPLTATVSVRVPARALILKAALVHEWAHHVEFQCEAHAEMRAEFVAAQGMPADTPWRLANGTTHISSSDWAHIPSEQYAETVIVLVLGSRPVATNAPITAEGMEAVKAWVQKKNLE